MKSFFEENKAMPRKIGLSLKRWLDLILLTIVAVLTCFLLRHHIFSISHYHFKTTAVLPHWLKYAIVSLITSFIWLIIIRLHGFRFSDLYPNRFFRYPPVWASGLFGAVIYAGLLFSILPISSTANLSSVINSLKPYFLSILFGIIITGVLSHFFTRNSPKVPTINSTNQITSFQTIDDPERLIEWIKEENPIKRPSEDFFDLSFIARRTAAYLLEPELGSVGIIGPYGSGKSSLLNLVDYYLLHPNELSGSTSNSYKGKILTKRFNGWGRQKGSIAQQILSIAIDTASEEIDCLSLVTMPAHYRSALSGTGNVVATILANLLGFTPDPLKSLQQLDDILKVACIRLIIFLEDIDRNTDDKLILNELPALLDNLGELTNFSFVFVMATEHKYADIITRICEHLESLP